jgi:hypothetical protein
MAMANNKAHKAEEEGERGEKDGSLLILRCCTLCCVNTYLLSFELRTHYKRALSLARGLGGGCVVVVARSLRPA